MGETSNEASRAKEPPVVDTGADLGTTDLGTTDLGTTDLGTTDLGTTDLGTTDLGTTDLGTSESDSAAAAAQWDLDGTDMAAAFVARAAANSSVVGRGRPSGRGASRAPSVRSARRVAKPTEDWSGPRRDDRDPQSLDFTLGKLVAEHGWANELRVHAVVSRWATIVGDRVAAHAVAEDFSPGETGNTGGVLTVRCDSTAWAIELRNLAPVLIARINEEVGHDSLVRVVVKGPDAPSWTKGPRRVAGGRGPRDTYG